MNNLDNKLLFSSNSFVPLFDSFDVLYLHNMSACAFNVSSGSHFRDGDTMLTPSKMGILILSDNPNNCTAHTCLNILIFMFFLATIL